MPLDYPYQLLNSHSTMIECSSNIVKNLMSTRDGTDFVSRLKECSKSDTHASDNSDDIQRFVRVEVD